MSSELLQISLADICSDVSYGYTESASTEPIGPKFLRITDIQGGTFEWDRVPFCPAADADIQKYRLTVGDIVVARTGNSTGENAQVSKEPPTAVFASYLIRFRPDAKRVNPFFVGYQLRAERFRQYVLSVRSGSAQPGANAKQLGAYPIQLISRQLQDSTVEILRALDDRISLLRETNTTLEAIAQALFKSWFVDFDPVHAKQQGNDPQGMDAATAALFPDSFEESELGEVPKGWRVAEIASVADILNGFAFKSDDYVDGEEGVFVLRTTNFSSDGYATRLEKDVFLPNSFISSHEKFLCQAFDFHLVMVGASVGHTSLLLPHMLPALRNQNMWCFRPKPSFPFKFFIHELVKINLRQALRGTSGSAREFLRKSDFSLIKVLLPSQSILTVFENQLTVLKDSIASNTHQASTLATLRDTLLPRLISGQLRLTDAQAQPEAFSS